MTKEGRRRVQVIKIQNFRAFPAKQDPTTKSECPVVLDLDADVALVSGPNGVGKTSLADALNLTLNKEAFDARVFYDRGKERAVWREGGGGYVALNDEELLESSRFSKAEIKKITGTPLASFATVFYQSDPDFQLDEYADRARVIAPAWAESVKVELESLSRAIREKVASYRPRNVPSEDEEKTRRDACSKAVRAALELVGESDAKQWFDGVFKGNGTLAVSKWAKALAGNLGMSVVDPHAALEETARRLEKEVARLTAAARVDTGSRPTFPWPQVVGRDPILQFIEARSLIPDKTEVGEWLVPIQNPDAAQELRRRAVKDADWARAKKAEIERLAPAVARVRPDEEAAAFETRLIALARDARAWLEAAELLEIAVPQRLRRIAAELLEGSEILEGEVSELRRDIEAKVTKRRREYLDARAREREAEDAVTAVVFGEAVVGDKEVLGDVENIVRERRTIRLSELRSAYERRSAEARNVREHEVAKAKPLLDLHAAVREWSKFEREATQWAGERRSANALRKADEAAKPYLRVIRQLVDKEGLLIAPPLLSDDLQKVSALANQVLEFTALRSKWKLELRLDKKRGVVPEFVSSKDSGRGLSLPNLSTGQKTLACLALALAFNLLASDIIKHDVLVFDDIGTALDLAQLPALAFVLRALAYAPEGQPRRQIVLASHHEDMTTRFIDLLAPPPGHRPLLVHAFEEWTLKDGPSIATYELRESADAESEDVVKEMFADLVTKGVQWLERRH